MSELYAMYRRCFPFCVREDDVVQSLLNDKSRTVIVERTPDGTLIGASVMEKNNILMLCVDRVYRNRGIGTRLLEQSEKTARDAGYAEITVGAGENYIMPGVPAVRPVVDESLRPDAVYAGLEDHTAFFLNRGYTHL